MFLDFSSDAQVFSMVCGKQVIILNGTTGNIQNVAMPFELFRPRNYHYSWWYVIKEKLFRVTAPMKWFGWDVKPKSSLCSTPIIRKKNWKSHLAWDLNVRFKDKEGGFHSHLLNQILPKQSWNCVKSPCLHPFNKTTEPPKLINMRVF